MEKSTRQWFNELPEPQRTEALENTVSERGEEYLDENISSSLTTALLSAFQWGASEQDHDYWSKIAYSTKETA